MVKEQTPSEVQIHSSDQGFSLGFSKLGVIGPLDNGYKKASMTSLGGHNGKFGARTHRWDGEGKVKENFV